MKKNIKNLLTKEQYESISKLIGEAEKDTSGEIRVSIRQKRHWREKKMSIEELARKEFQLLGMTKTKERVGVLIFLLVEDRKFYILADEGIHLKAGKEFWEKTAKDMEIYFTQNKFYDGIVYGIKTVGAILSQHCPRRPDDVNELPNEVSIR